MSYNNRGKFVRCGSCNGTGNTLCMGEEACPHCAGTGRDKRSDLWAEPCGNCNGRGRVTYCRYDPRSPCRVCNGTGTLQY